MSTFMTMMYPEKKTRSILAHSLNRNSPEPMMNEAVADASTNAKTFAGFFCTAMAADAISPAIVEAPISISTQAKLVMSFLCCIQYP